MADEHDRSMMENLYWWGIPTMFRCKNETLANQDIALVGVPHSTGEWYNGKGSTPWSTRPSQCICST
jgi:hypothetical protein